MLGRNHQRNRDVRALFKIDQLETRHLEHDQRFFIELGENIKWRSADVAGKEDFFAACFEDLINQC